MGVVDKEDTEEEYTYESFFLKRRRAEMVNICRLQDQEMSKGYGGDYITVFYSRQRTRVVDVVEDKDDVVNG